ncbi:ATP-binding domain-containing protein [Acinetobacter bereziniae]|uniref:DEAD/DEAH box helicase n=1 Tax=Acinetobacter bereziniae TaxID=106648 RepID=UPI003212AE3E
MSSYFFIHAEKNSNNADLIESLEKYAENNKTLIYVLNKPLTDQKYNYSYNDAIIVLSPKHKVFIINSLLHGSNEPFEDFVEDVLEDVGSISDKYLYKEVIGRPRQWRKKLVNENLNINEIKEINDLFESNKLSDSRDIKDLDLLISLFIGSINDIDRVKDNIPLTLLDQVKQKIQLFDADQTRFIYEEIPKKRIVIQGLSGTGKTELLLHKLKDLYINHVGSKIYFTCHNKILADSLKKRIPEFFNFMKVEQQIEWNERLWCTNAWGGSRDVNSGAYRFICAFYQIPFYSYSPQMSFSKACALAFDDIREKYKDIVLPHAFNYMFIDENQDFDENFFQLCELVTEKNIYIAGDIFQSIFDDCFSDTIEPDFLLGKCYRTDPKTLMFAHALGMGLFETEKLRWLEKREWEDCGYNVQIESGKYLLSREPLRRFEDLEDDFESLKILEVQENYSDTIVGIIRDIKAANETLLPEDIGIIFLDSGNDIYSLANILEYKIENEFGWTVNKAYETKEKIKDQVFISNKNNVKGLEFPFVICVTRAIKNNSMYRNSIYTMLTRSFIKSYLVISSKENSGLTNEMKAGLREIILNKRMIIDEPSPQEKELIRTRFKYQLKQQSLYDRLIKVFENLSIDKKYYNKLMEMTQNVDLADQDYSGLEDFVKFNMRYIKD